MFFNYRVKNPILYFFILISGKIRFEWHLTARKTISDEVPKLCLICLLLNVHRFIRKVNPHRDMVSEDIHVSDPTTKKKNKQTIQNKNQIWQKKKKEKQTFENVAYTKIWIILSFLLFRISFGCGRLITKSFWTEKPTFNIADCPSDDQVIKWKFQLF